METSDLKSGGGGGLMETSELKSDSGGGPIETSELKSDSGGGPIETSELKSAELKSDGGGGAKENADKDADHISRLCNAVIHHILSFLPIPDAARTSVLSKRWKNLWASIPNLDFDQKFFIDTIGGDLRSHPARALADFMNGALMFRERAPIHLLRLSLDYNPSFYYLIRQWIQLSMKFNVQEVHLNFYGGDFFRKNHCLFSTDSLEAYHCCDSKSSRRSWDYDSASDITNEAADEDASESGTESDTSDDSASDSDDDKDSASSDNEPGKSTRFTLIPSLFTCTSVRVLQLVRCNLNLEGGDIGFRNLTSLVLRDVEISEQLLHEMLAKCSLLEKLELKKINKLKHLDFSSPKLQSMKLECCHSLKKVFVDAPELRHLKLGVSSTLKEVSLHFPALIKAEIGLCHNINCDKKKRATRLVKLLKNFFLHVEDLTLYSKYFKDVIIPKAQAEDLTMPNIRRFEIIGELGKGATTALFGLLKAFDNLESLCLTCVHPKRHPKFKVLYEAMQLRKVEIASVSCLQHHLKELTINGFEGSDIQIKLLEFIRDNAKALKKVEINTYTPSFLTHKDIRARLLNWRELEIKYE